jgi:Transposase DDE domain group 1
MRVSHTFPAISATFDDPNLVSCGGLAPAMALAQRAGLGELVADTLTLKAKGGVNAHVKVPALVAGMVAGADSIDDMDLLRHGGMERLFDGVRAPSTLGTFLRSFTFGHVRQLDAVASRFLVGLARSAPILPGAGQGCFVDVDDTIKATYGYQKQGVGYGYTKVKGLNALLAIVSTPVSAPVIAATRLRRGGTNSVRGAARPGWSPTPWSPPKPAARAGWSRCAPTARTTPMTWSPRPAAAVPGSRSLSADMKGGALAHLPSASFSANSAWLVLAAIAFNLTRAAGAIASVFHAKASTATIRRQLIAVPARLATSARRLVLHLPTDWPWWDSWQGLFNAVCGPPAPVTT